MRAVRPILITLAVLAVLFVVVDRVAVWFAESEAADQLRQSRQTDGKPSVSIDGFPFLTQLLGGELDDVHASAKGLQAEGDDGTSVRVTELDMDLKNVKFSDGFSSATAASASGDVLISYDDLSDAAPNGVRVSYGGQSGKAGVSDVKATVRVPLLGEQSVVSEVRLEDGDTVTVRAKSIPGSEIAGVEEKVRQYTDFSKQVTGLPAGIRLTSLRATPEGVRIEVGGSQVSLDR